MQLIQALLCYCRVFVHPDEQGFGTICAYRLIVIDIEKINKRHFLETDMFYRIEMGLSSRLMKYANGVFHLEVVIGRKWERNYSAAAAEMAHCWQKANEELSHAIACKVYIVDIKKNPYKQVLLQSEVDVEYDARKGILFYRQHLN